MTTFLEDLGLLGAVAAAVATLALLAGCVAHLSRPTALPDALRAHRTLPERSVPLAASAVTLAEGVLGVAVVVAFLSQHRLGLTVALGATALLFTSYALYTRHTLANGRGGPCGCSRREVPLSGWVVGRAWTFAALALVAAVLTASAGSLADAPSGGAETVTAALAALTFATLLWLLPAAMAQPSNKATGPTIRVRQVHQTHQTRQTRQAHRGGPQPWTS